MGSCRDSRHWSLEVGGCLIQVVVKAGFTVIIIIIIIIIIISIYNSMVSCGIRD